MTTNDSSSGQLALGVVAAVGGQVATQTTALEPLYGFDHFWEAWPRRGGKRLYRGKAEQFWARLSLPERKAAWRGAVHYAQACANGTQGAMDAFRWLRDRSWDDWQEPASGGPTVGRPTSAQAIAAAAAGIRTGQTALFGGAR